MPNYIRAEGQSQRIVKRKKREVVGNQVMSKANRKAIFSRLIPVFLRMLRRVPFFKGLLEWTGMGTVMTYSAVVFWYIRWLPVCLTKAKPSFSRMEQSFLPFIWGSLAIYDKFQLFHLPLIGKMRDVFKTDDIDIPGCSIFDHRYRLLNCFPLGGYVKLRTVNDKATFFGRGKFSGDFDLFHDRSSVAIKQKSGSLITRLISCYHHAAKFTTARWACLPVSRNHVGWAVPTNNQ